MPKPDGNPLHYVYGLTDPRDGALRYIGMTVAPHSRLLAHVGDSSWVLADKCTPKERWIKGLLAAGLRPEMFIIEECPAETARATEKFWNEYFRSLGCDLTSLRGIIPARPPVARKHRKTQQQIRKIIP